MQYTMQVFEYEEENKFRVIDRDGEPWFVLLDVARHLGLKNAAHAATRLDDDERDVIVNDDDVGRRQRMTVINESGLYSLILTSRVEGAKKFKKWVTSKVLPSIRKTGGYGAKVPAFIKRFNQNWDRVETGYFSVISELTVRVWGRFELVGYVMPDKSAAGKEIRPDVSVGRGFSDWLKKEHPQVSANFSYYPHKTPETEIDARQYPNSMLPLFIEYVDTVWIPENAEAYFSKRDPAALPYLPRLLPANDKPKAGMIKKPRYKSG